MAAALEAKLSPYECRVWRGRFEEWPADPQVDMVVAATSLHWVELETAADRLAAALRPGGLLAPFWVRFASLPRYEQALNRITDRLEFPQPIAQFLAAFPAILFFPVVVSGIVLLRLNPNIWLSPLMILGTQWYILFNVIAGASAFPTDLREAAGSFHLGGWRWWMKVILPGIFPYYITGAITASGGSWNASIVAEVASWGDTHLTAAGLGAYIARATEAGDFPRVVLGIAVMCILVTLFNRLLWRPLYAFGERRLRLG